MRVKRALLVINPRAGHNVTRIADLVAVFAAAGWRVNIALKAYAKQATELAARASRQGYDLVIAYGGDGTINKVINGVLSAKGHSVVGALSGGTANEWAIEIGLPLDPVLAALALVNSDVRTIDLGCIGVQRLIFPHTASNHGEQQATVPSRARKVPRQQAKGASKVKRRFLLMAGLGVDAQILPYVSKSLKYQVGSRAFEAAATAKLSSLRSFPAEICTLDAAGQSTLLWRGEAWQLFVANARLYGSIVNVAPEAYLDDGKLDVCVITAGNLLATVGQITSLLLRRKPDDESAEYFQAAHFSIRVPASIGMHLDGSLVKLKDYLSKSDREALEQVGDTEQVMVEYRFDSEPHVLQIAIPRTYDDSLFEKSANTAQKHAGSQLPRGTSPLHDNGVVGEQPEAPERVDTLLEQGCKVTVVGVAPNPERSNTYIIAGVIQKQQSGDNVPVSVYVDNNTVAILRQTGEHVEPAVVQELQAGAAIVVEGRKSKRGVIRATRVVI